MRAQAFELEAQDAAVLRDYPGAKAGARLDEGLARGRVFERRRVPDVPLGLRRDDDLPRHRGLSDRLDRQGRQRLDGLRPPAPTPTRG